jgi:PAS domain S-box-containing protein
MTMAAPKNELDFGYVFQRCVEGSNDAVMLTDISARIFYVNGAWERLYGFSREEAIGQTPRLLRSGHHGPAFYEAMWRQILDYNRGYWQGEIVNLAKDGREVPVLVTISPFRNENGVLKGYMSFAVDMTERKKLEAQILRQDRLASIGLLASGLAHEIGTPLGVIRGRAEFLARGLSDETGDKASLGIIVAQIDRISKLIYALLNLSRVGPAEHTTRVSVAKAAEEVKCLVEQELEKNAIELRQEIPPELIVRAESDRLGQVFLNLVMNAIHAIAFAAAHGRTEGHYLRLSAAREDSEWEISVEDTGCGIPAENRMHLFKPFFTTKEVGSGTGLGLAITHQLVQSWGGKIWAEARPVHGTIFKIRLPAA